VSRINMSQSYGDLGETLRFMGRARWADARDAYAEQQKVCEAALADYPSDGLLKNNLAATFKGQAELFHRDGQLKEAQASYRKGLAVQEKLVEALPADSLYRRLLGQLNFGLANALSAEDQLAEAEQHYRRGVELFERLLLEDQPLARYYRNELARCLASCPAVAVRNPARALTLAKQAVEAAPNDARCMQTLGIAQYRADDAKAALQTLVESVHLSKGGNYFDAFYLALTLHKLGRTKDAQVRYNDGLRMLGKQPILDGELRCLRSEVAAVLGQE
jgi:tetratricopeptide (TPR) repeat protein